MSAAAALRLRAEMRESNCLPWAGHVNDRGYGKTADQRMAHVVAYEQTFGPVPDGLVVDHVCHNLDPDCLGGHLCPHRRCVHPAHLEAVTNRENVLRGKGETAINAAKTVCIHGHTLTPENTFIRIRDGRPTRECRICRRRTRRDAKRRRRDLVAAAAAHTDLPSGGSPPNRGRVQ